MKSKFNNHDELPRLSPIEKTVIKDPERTIRKKFEAIRKLRKSDRKSIDPTEFEADEWIRERRIKAIINSLETAQKYDLVQEWIDLNTDIFGYSKLESNLNVMYAASIWILDRIEETNYDRNDLYRLLPTDKDTVYKYVPELDIWDSKYDSDLIASVEYLIYTRNMDIAPLEKNDMGDYRVIADSVSARGKNHEDTPCRKRFEKLISMIPQKKIDLAVKHFISQYDNWCENYFMLTGMLENECSDLRKLMNDITDKYNTAVDEYTAIEADIKKYTHKYGKQAKAYKNLMDIENGKIKSTKRKISIIKKLGLRSERDLNKLARELQYAKDDIKTGIYQKTLDDLMLKLDDRSNEICDIYDKYCSVYEKYEQSLEKKMDSVFITANIALEIQTEGITNSNAVYDKIKRSIFADPFEMCFALLYLIEMDSDIPWTYGACIGMMMGVTAYLPFSIFQRREEYSGSSATAYPIIPNWFKREYRRSDDSAPISLAQIVYRETGCMMPRDMHKLDSTFEYLKEYGITGSKAVGLLYCMLSLDAARNSMKALNFDKEYMRKLGGIDSDNLPKTEDQIEIQKLRKELHAAKNETKQGEISYEELMAKYKAEHQELADLREILFNTNSDKQEAETNSSVRFPYEIKHNTVIFGGHDSWVKGIKNKLKGNVRYVSKDSISFDPSLIRNAEVIWVQWKAISHSSFDHITEEARKNQKAIRYFTNSGVFKCAEQAALHDIELC